MLNQADGDIKLIANGQNEEKYAAIAAENERLVEENEILKENEKNISNTARGQTFEDLLNQANLFVDLVYVQKVCMESRIISDNYYIENMDMNQQEVDVLMEIKHEINYVESGKKDESHMFLRVSIVPVPPVFRKSTINLQNPF